MNTAVVLRQTWSQEVPLEVPLKVTVLVQVKHQCYQWHTVLNPVSVALIQVALQRLPVTILTLIDFQILHGKTLTSNCRKS